MFIVLDVTRVTIYFRQEIIAKHLWNRISTGKAGVAYSLKRAIKKSINGKIKAKIN